MNHTDVPPTPLLLDPFDVAPTRNNGLGLYRDYWFFTNLQVRGCRWPGDRLCVPAGCRAACHMPGMCQVMICRHTVRHDQCFRQRLFE